MNYRVRGVSKDLARTFVSGGTTTWGDTRVADYKMWHKEVLIAKIVGEKISMCAGKIDPTIIDRLNAICNVVYGRTLFVFHWNNGHRKAGMPKTMTFRDHNTPVDPARVFTLHFITPAGYPDPPPAVPVTSQGNSSPTTV